VNVCMVSYFTRKYVNCKESLLSLPAIAKVQATRSYKVPNTEKEGENNEMEEGGILLESGKNIIFNSRMEKCISAEGMKKRKQCCGSANVSSGPDPRIRNRELRIRIPQAS
jgi:hypothetical protein